VALVDPAVAVRLPVARLAAGFLAVDRPAADLAPVDSVLAAAAEALACVVVLAVESPVEPSRFELRRPGRERGRLPITPGSSLMGMTIPGQADQHPSPSALALTVAVDSIAMKRSPR
jgi:hypothetical protein